MDFLTSCVIINKRGSSAHRGFGYSKHNINGPMHNTMELLKQINKTKFLIPYEQLYIQSHHHHKQLIPEQNIGEYNPMYQLVYD
jgi:hypothetical protein